MDSAAREALQRTLTVRIATGDTAYERTLGEMRIIGRVVMKGTCYMPEAPNAASQPVDGRTSLG